jgi:hypothetical protein
VWLFKTEIKKNDSFPGFLDNDTAGMMAPKIFPRWGLPEA